jgi:hypothetical protein
VNRLQYPIPCARLAAVLCLGAACAAPMGCAQNENLVGGSQRGQGESILEVFAPPSPAEVAAWATDPFDPDKRQRGILTLAGAYFGGERVYLNLYRVALEDEDAGVRAAAARALSLHGRVEDAPALAQALERDQSVLVRREAARALQRIHDPGVVEVLLRAADEAREEDGDVRALAATALGQYKQFRVVQGLIGALQDRLLRVNDAAVASLRTLTGQDFGLETAEWLAWVGDTQDLFAAGTPYEYPVFQRDPTFAEKILPWRTPPNEIASQPVGVEPPAPAGGGPG